jgi:hypothetical protein
MQDLNRLAIATQIRWDINLQTHKPVISTEYRYDRWKWLRNDQTFVEFCRFLLTSTTHANSKVT